MVGFLIYIIIDLGLVGVSRKLIIKLQTLFIIRMLIINQDNLEHFLPVLLCGSEGFENLTLHIPRTIINLSM